MMGSAASDPPQPPWRSSMRVRVNTLIGKRRRYVLAFSFGTVLSGMMEAAILAAVAEIAATLVSGAKRVHLTVASVHLTPTVGSLILGAFVLVVVRLMLQVPISMLPSRVVSDVQASLRMNMFGAFTRASWSMKSQDKEGHLQEIMTSQVLQATQGALQVMAIINSLLTFLILMISALALNVVVAVTVVVAAAVLFALLRPLNQRGAAAARRLSQAQMAYASGIGEASRVAEDTQVFGVGDAQRRQLDGLIVTARDLFFRTQVYNRLSPSVYQSLVYLVLVAGVGVMYAAGTSHVASLGAVVLLVVRAGTYGQTLQSSYQALRQSLPFLDRLQDSESRYSESAPFEGQLPLQSVQSLAFENVSFAYRPGQPVLEDVSFEMTGGEAVGIIGPSGAGKSTLVQLLLRLRVPEEGTYLVNGEPAARFARDDWHRLIAYVPQEPRLLHASVAENVRFFRDLDDDAVERACRLARIHDDVTGWPKGYDTVIGPRADAVSGGQQQRICLARALAARPEVLVLDEPTSALDPHSETLIQESLTALKRDLTVFIIAHRMSTLNICERVMVVIGGRLVAFDTTELLARQNDYYRSASGIAAVGALGDGLL